MPSFRLVSLSIKELMTYKVNVIIFMLYGLLPLMTALVVSDPPLIAYYTLVFIVSQLVNGWTANKVANDISSGHISHYLLLPRQLIYPYAISRMAMLLFVAPLLAFVVLIYYFIDLDYQPLNLGLGFISILMAVLLQFYLSVSLGLIASFTTQSNGIISCWFALLLPLSGVMLPLEHFPEMLYQMLLFTPFPYYVYVPVKTLMEPMNMTLLASQCVMVFLSYGLYQAMRFAFLKRYVAYGS